MNSGKKLLLWYQKHQRDLPWRQNTNPYRVWIAEVMLQQTTVKTVIPYYKKFLKKFPDVNALAQSPLSRVLPFWAGLGYYLRAKNLHRASRLFAKKGKIPKTSKELMTYPGFGDYTAKAVSSIAYGEPVSVIDGNVIRFLCRLENLPLLWWEKKERLKLEKLADRLRGSLSPGEMNQAMMELGSEVCRPRRPLCRLCPVNQNCKAKKQNTIEGLPLKKPRIKKEIWFWRPQILIKDQKIKLSKKHGCPFLKNQPLPPGKIQKKKKAPKHFDFRHQITHYDLFVKIEKPPSKRGHLKKDWHKISSIKKVSPSSLVSKILKSSALNKTAKKGRP